MDEYRNENVEKHTQVINVLLQAIAGKEYKNLGSFKNLQKDDVANIEEAIIMSMQEAANKALVQLTAMAIGFDRVLAAFEQAIQEMEDEDMPNGRRYRNRVAILTNFESIVKELTPPKVAMSRAKCYDNDDVPEE